MSTGFANVSSAVRPRIPVRWAIFFGGLVLPVAALMAAETAPVELCLGDFAPFNSPSLANGGPVIEIATEAYRRVGYQVHVQFLPWARVVRQAEANQCGVLGIWRDPARDLVYNYSTAMLSMELGFFGRRDTLYDLGNSSVLEPLLIGMQRASYLSPSLNNKNLRFEPVVDVLSSLRMLASRRVDLTYGNKAQGQLLINTNDELRGVVEWKAPALEAKEHLLAFSKSYPDGATLLRAFNQGLESMKADGSYRKILSAGKIGGSP